MDLERAIALGEQGLKLARHLGDQEGAAATLLNLGVAEMLRGELERATTIFEDGLPLFRALGNKGGLARSCLAMGCLAMGVITMLRTDHEQDYERAKALFEEGLAVSQESGDVYSSSLAINQLALMALLQGDYGRAETLCEECLELNRQSGMAHNIAFALQISAALAGTRRQPVRSARLWGAAEALREAIGTAFAPLEHRTFEPYIAAPRDQMDDVAWEAAWQEGRAMSMGVAIEYALSKGDDFAPAKTSTLEEKQRSQLPGGLTRREEDIAALVARGLTNRQIALELSISEHTVANHVARILRKLGLDSRSQITSWVIERRTPP
jgi:DNA-binding CsgD family transcriptional regulator